MKKGFIKKSISNHYTLIDLETRKQFVAHARGKLRYTKVDEKSSFNLQTSKRTKKERKIMQISPKVGDSVLYDDTGGQPLIIDILPRKNSLERPDVSNVDQVLLVFSAVEPEFSFHLLDKFLIIMNQENLEPVIIISKVDLINEAKLGGLKKDLEYYLKMGYEIYYVDSKQKIGVDVLTHIFKNKISVLAGQTGVGKSTLLNALLPELKLKTQEISKALGRGKHTTRHTELYLFNEGYIVDTPGFSKIEFVIFYADELKMFYPDFVKLSKSCKFKASCLHLSEPNCAIKKAVEKGDIIQSRYDNYKQFLQEIKDQKDKY